MEKNFQELIELMETFEKSKIDTLKYAEGDFSIELGKNCVSKANYKVPEIHMFGMGQCSQQPIQLKELSNHELNPKVIDNSESNQEHRGENLQVIKAPLVGVFYESKEPGADPFVREGDFIKKGDVLGILESMKMMNEIKSPFDGKIMKISCKNGQIAEYNQELFLVEEAL